MALMKEPKKLAFKSGQVVYCIPDNMYAMITTANPAARYPYALLGEVGVKRTESELRGLTARELGL